MRDKPPYSTDPPLEPSKVRKGRFLWMDAVSRSDYLSVLTKRIAQGYFFSDAVLSEIVDEIAPIIEENTGQEFLPV